MIDSLLQSLSIGPVNLPLIVVPLFIAWVIYQILIKRFYLSRNDWLQKVDRIMFNALFIILLVWKLSPVVLQFSTVSKNPTAVLYLPGGIPGIILGLAAAAIYGAHTILKQKDSRLALVKSLGLNLGVLLVLFSVLSLATGLIVDRLNLQSGISAVAPGVEAPDFNLEAEDGKIYQLADYTGQTVVLNFWASWCPPCRAELPELKKFYNEESSDDVVFLSINMFTTERDPANLPAFIREEGLSFPVLYDLTGQAASDYAVVSIPTTVIIGRDGRISSVKSGAVTNAWLKRAIEL